MGVSGIDALNTLITSPHLEKMKKLVLKEIFFNCSSPAVTHLSFVIYLEISSQQCMLSLVTSRSHEI